jgi:hypothetical protein
MRDATNAVDVSRTPAVASDSFDADTANYSYGIALALPHNDAHSTEQWARVCLEQLPVALRWCVIAGWRFVLGLRLGPRPSPDHVLGWKVIRRLRDETVLEVRSAFLTAHLVFRRDGTRLVWSTFVHYDRWIAAFIWPPVSYFHGPIVAYALRTAALRTRGDHGGVRTDRP